MIDMHMLIYVNKLIAQNVITIDNVKRVSTHKATLVVNGSIMLLERMHMYKGVSHALVLVDTNKNVLCAGHNAIVKKISAKKLP